MPYPPSHRIKVKERILSSARRLFNRRGFNAVSIDNIMAEAGLTRGSFYTYFDSKSALYAEAVTHAAFANPSQDIDGDGAHAGHLAAQVARAYLSAHAEETEAPSPLIALPGDVGSADPRVRTAFENALKMMLGIFEQGLFEKGLPRDARPPRDRALAIAALCIGGTVLSRSIEDRALADEARKAALAAALSLGEWEQRENGPVTAAAIETARSAPALRQRA